jgi:hypothetical protein
VKLTGSSSICSRRVFLPARNLTVCGLESLPAARYHRNRFLGHSGSSSSSFGGMPLSVFNLRVPVLCSPPACQRSGPGRADVIKGNWDGHIDYEVYTASSSDGAQLEVGVRGCGWLTGKVRSRSQSGLAPSHWHWHWMVSLRDRCRPNEPFARITAPGRVSRLQSASLGLGVTRLSVCFFKFNFVYLFVHVLFVTCMRSQRTAL